ncbi:MAG: hypothetical protein ACREWG_05905 [Gammaproteobacteria bacterium]
MTDANEIAQAMTPPSRVQRVLMSLLSQAPQDIFLRTGAGVGTADSGWPVYREYMATGTRGSHVAGGPLPLW